MFVGIVEERGRITHTEPSGDGIRITVEGAKTLEGLRHGDSISVDGVCLTAVDSSATSFTADVMAQTITMTTVGSFHVGDEVNLERAAQLGDRIGGHIVQGHVDGTGEILAVRPGEKWKVLRISLPRELAPLVVDKGSIAVNGVSLTTSAVSPSHVGGKLADSFWFEVSLIPATLEITNMDALRAGDRVNIETDILIRHAARMNALKDPTENTTP